MRFCSANPAEPADLRLRSEAEAVADLSTDCTYVDLILFLPIAARIALKSSLLKEILSACAFCTKSAVIL